MGSSSLEITLIQLTNGLYRILDSIYSLEIGGDLFTDLIVQILIEEFKRKNRNMDPSENKRSMSKLKSDAEYLKNILSTMERAHCSIDALYEGIDFDYYLTRQRFEGSCSKLYSSCLKPIDDLLAKNNLKEIDIDKLIVCGAATKMCKLQLILKEKFPSTTQLLNQLSTDEVIALGCAKQASILSASKLKKFDPSDVKFQCLAKSVFMKIGGEENDNKILIFEPHSPIPIKRLITVNLDGPQQVFIYENDNKLLAKIDLSSFTSKEVNCLFQIKL
jgi:molecular chaperone DnaK (HSP70)